MGGAVSYVSRAPADQMGARVRLNVGNFNQRQLTVNMDVPITPNFNQIDSFNTQKDGYVQSGNAQIQHGDENNTVTRLDMLWHASADVDVRFDVTSTQSNPNHPNADVLYDVNDAQAFARQMQAIPGVNFTDATQAFGGREEYRNTSTFAGPGWQLDATSYNVTIDWDISDTLHLRSITGGREYDSDALADLDATEYQFFEIFTAARVQEKSTELQLISDGDRLDWVLGFMPMMLKTGNDDLIGSLCLLWIILVR